MKNIVFSQIRDAVSILKLDKEKMLEITHRKTATFWGVMILLIPPVINLILASFTFPSGFSVIFSRFMLWPIFIPALSVVGVIFLSSLIAKKSFGGRGDHIGYFRVLAFSSFILWVTIIPFILSVFGIGDPLGVFNLVSSIAAIWIFAVLYHMLLNFHRISQDDAVIVIVVSIIGFFVLKGVLGRILVGKVYRLWY